MKKNFISIVAFLFTLVGPSSMYAQVIQVQNVSMTVSSMEQSIDFYTQVLDFKLIKTWTWAPDITSSLFGLPGDSTTTDLALLQLGDEQLELMQFRHAVTGRPIPADSRSNDLWFQHIAIVVSDMPKAYQQLEARHVERISSFPQTLPKSIPNAAGISAYYFLDPDRHVLELISFPKDKGKAKWHISDKNNKQQRQDQLFLGIDHTAIAVEDSEEGFRFYRDELGLEIKGHSLNFGTEQEHLNQVFGARVYITGLSATQGMGVEFLEYIAPPGGRSMPRDSRPTDLWHWHTSMLVGDLPRDIQSLDTSTTIISERITSLGDHTNALLIRDQDGHAILLLEMNPSFP